MADAIVEKEEFLLAANAADLSRMDKENPLYDRLQLTHERLEGIASDMRHLAEWESPLGNITNEKTLDNGLLLRRISVPFGVIGVIYEARPNVTFDVFSLCFKSGNACVLKGGKDADSSNRAVVALIKDVLTQEGINPDIINLLPATHEATAEMLNAVGYIDLCIPRGGKKPCVGVQCFGLLACSSPPRQRTRRTALAYEGEGGVPLRQLRQGMDVAQLVHMHCRFARRGSCAYP